MIIHPQWYAEAVKPNPRLDSAWYREVLLQAHQAEKARAYLEERGFTPETLERFAIGYAPNTWEALTRELKSRGYATSELVKVGLAAQNDRGGLRDRFRGRLMIPIRDHQGRVVAFTARQTERTPADDPAREAKYVNSPETPIFTKGNLLFNLDRARTAVGDGKPFVLVEGQLDALKHEFERLQSVEVVRSV